jgi:NAD(P)-dependent dehydrogenase (short-subunit alcohol dehydrogenase family)
VPKITLITGGSRGIGAATARLAAQRGYSVCISFLHNQAAAETVVAGITASHQ